MDTIAIENNDVLQKLAEANTRLMVENATLQATVDALGKRIVELTNDKEQPE